MSFESGGSPCASPLAVLHPGWRAARPSTELLVPSPAHAPAPHAAAARQIIAREPDLHIPADGLDPAHALPVPRWSFYSISVRSNHTRHFQKRSGEETKHSFEKP